MCTASEPDSVAKAGFLLPTVNGFRADGCTWPTTFAGC